MTVQFSQEQNNNLHCIFKYDLSFFHHKKIIIHNLNTEFINSSENLYQNK